MCPKHENPTLRCRLSAVGSFFRLLVIQCFSFSAFVAAAQDVPTLPEPSLSAQPPASPPVNSAQFTPGPVAGNPGTTPASPLAGTSQLATPAPAAVQAPLAIREGVLGWGLLHLHPHFLYQLSYGNGLEPLPGQQVNTLINQFSPGVMVQLGPHWTLDYTPTFRFYSDRRFQDATDQAVSLRGAIIYEDWAFGFSQGYSATTDPLIETGAQIAQEAYTTGLTASYQMNSKVSLTFGLNQNFRFVGQNNAFADLTDLREWSTMDWFNYQLEPRLNLGIGAGFTYDNLAIGPDVTSEQYQGRLQWSAGNKLSLSLIGGLDDRQFLHSNSPDLLSPTFSASLGYRLFETTTLSLSASRAVIPSYFKNEVTEGTALSASVNQRLLKRLSLNVTGSYGTTAFHGTTTVAAPTNIQSYNTTSFSASLGTTFFKRANASVFYSVAYNSSGAAVYNYTTTQVGLTLGYHF